MNKIIQPYSIYPITKERLAKLAQLASTPEHKVSASAYLDQLVADRWRMLITNTDSLQTASDDLDRLQLVIEDGDLVQSDQTPYDGPTYEAV